jgi:hypothetical protein
MAPVEKVFAAIKRDSEEWPEEMKKLEFINYLHKRIQALDLAWVSESFRSCLKYGLRALHKMKI